MDQQNSLKNNNRRISMDMPINATLQKLCMLYLLVWSISPPLAIDNIYRVAALVAAGVWFILSMANGMRFEQVHLYAFGFLLMVMLINVIENQGNVSNLMKSISYYMLVIAFIMNHGYENRWDELRSLVPIFLVLVIIFNIITFRELLVDPTLARKIVRADEEMYPYMRRGVGGYALIYTQVFLFPLLLAWTAQAFKRNKVLFLMGSMWALTYILLILNAGYSIAIITTISSLVILLIYRKKSVVPALIITSVIIVLLVLLIGYVDAFREALLTFFDGTKVANKVNDIYDSIHGVEVADSISERIDRYTRSIQTIFSYPLIGGLWIDSGGGHSALLDIFAKYGLWGIWIFIKMFFCVPLRIKKESDNPKDMRIANALLSSMILITLLDSLPYDMTFPVMMIVPILFSQIQQWRNENEGSLDSQPAAA